MVLIFLQARRNNQTTIVSGSSAVDTTTNEVTFDVLRFPVWTYYSIFDRIVEDADATGGTDYAFSFRSLGHNTTNYFEFDVEVPVGGDTLVVRKRNSSESLDKFRILVDGVTKHTSGGSSGSYDEVTVALSAGTRTIRMQYSKDSSASVASDTTFISKISTTANILPLKLLASTVYTFDDETVPEDFTFDAAGESIVARADATYGTTHALKFRTISHSQTTYFDVPISLTDPGTLFFRYERSAESVDKMRVYVDGVKYVDGGGQGAFYQIVASIPAGTYNIRFEYNKDSSVSSGDDTVYYSVIDVSKD